MERQVFRRMAEIDAEHWWFAARREILSDLVKRMRLGASHNIRILEIGCGTGHNLKMLGQFGSVDATELDDEARALAATRLGRKVSDAALPDLGSYPPASFDLIALLDVLEHVSDDTAALDAIRARLKPGGFLLLTIPANPWMWSAHDVAHHHHRRYRKQEIRELLKSAGYSLQLLSYFNTLLFPLIAAARIMNKFSGREGSDEQIPREPVNSILRSVFSCERRLVGRIPLPFGVSLVAIARKS